MMLFNFLQWLKQNKAINILLVLVYGIALIFFHDFFVRLSVRVMNHLTLGVYNQVVVIISICFGALLLMYLFYRLKLISLITLKTDSRPAALKLGFLLATSLLIVLHYTYLFEMNIEVVHVVEFALLSVLLYPLTGRFGAAIVFTLPFILVNEWYQYSVLYPTYIHYFEFNDIAIDLLGCGMAMICLWIAGINPEPFKQVFWKRAEFLFLAAIDLAFVILLCTCLLSLYPETKCNNTLLVLNQLDDPDLFWQTHVFGAVYHVMKPIEGMIAINCICLFFTFTDYAASHKL